MSNMTVLPKPVFPYFIDSTIVAGIKSCPFQTALAYLYNLRARGTGYDLHVGSVFASALERTRKAYYGEKLSADEAVFEGHKVIFSKWGDVETPSNREHKALYRVLDAFSLYFERSPLGEEQLTPVVLSDGAPGVEYTFAIPIPELRHPDTDEPLLYVGRFDQLAEYRSAVLVHDDKTTSQLGASWPEKWHLRGQFIGYIWACRQGGLHASGYAVRGICFYKHYTELSPLVTGFISENVIADWYQSMVLTVQQFIEQYKRGVYVKAFSDPCSAYNGCAYKPVCGSANPAAWLDDYEVHVWDPLKEQA